MRGEAEGRGVRREEGGGRGRGAHLDTPDARVHEGAVRHVVHREPLADLAAAEVGGGAHPQRADHIHRQHAVLLARQIELLEVEANLLGRLLDAGGHVAPAHRDHVEAEPADGPQVDAANHALAVEEEQVRRRELGGPALADGEHGGDARQKEQGGELAAQREVVEGALVREVGRHERDGDRDAEEEDRNVEQRLCHVGGSLRREQRVVAEEGTHPSSRSRCHTRPWEDDSDLLQLAARREEELEARVDVAGAVVHGVFAQVAPDVLLHVAWHGVAVEPVRARLVLVLLRQQVPGDEWVGAAVDGDVVELGTLARVEVEEGGQLAGCRHRHELAAGPLARPGRDFIVAAHAHVGLGRDAAAGYKVSGGRHAPTAVDQRAEVHHGVVSSARLGRATLDVLGVVRHAAAEQRDEAEEDGVQASHRR